MKNSVNKNELLVLINNHFKEKVLSNDEASHYSMTAKPPEGDQTEAHTAKVLAPQRPAVAT